MPPMKNTAVLEPVDLNGGLDRPSAKTWDGLSRMAFAANWDPESASDPLNSPSSWEG